MSTRPRASITNFRFTPLIPGGPAGKIITFEAHISALRDTSSPQWNATYDMGRADPKVFYAGFSRSIGINFIVVSTTKKEHEQNFIALRRLVTLTYPIYRGRTRGYNAPHVKVEIGNLLAVIGYVSSFDMSWDNETPWIDEKPILTEVSLDVSVLADGAGRRPEYDDGEYKHFTQKI